MSKVRHLYVHVPFCAHRCGYCDFVTVTGHDDQHATYVDAVLAELAPRSTSTRPASTPCSWAAVRRRCSARRCSAACWTACRRRAERTVECNPETVTPELARALADRGLRVSLGAQSFQAPLLAVLDDAPRPPS